MKLLAKLRMKLKNEHAFEKALEEALTAYRSAPNPYAAMFGSSSVMDIGRIIHKDDYSSSCHRVLVVNPSLCVEIDWHGNPIGVTDAFGRVHLEERCPRGHKGLR